MQCMKLPGYGLIATIAALAFGASTVGSAPAATGGHFVFGEEYAYILGTDEPANPNVFTLFGTTFTCQAVTYGAIFYESDKTSTELSVTPQYSNCTGFGLPIHFSMNNCNYLVTIGPGNPAVTDNTTHLMCPNPNTGPTLTATGPFGHCTIEVTANQTPTGGVTYSQGNTHSQLTVDVTTSGIHAVIKQGGFFQCLTSATTDSGATVTGALIGVSTGAGGGLVAVTATGSG